MNCGKDVFTVKGKTHISCFSRDEVEFMLSTPEGKKLLSNNKLLDKAKKFIAQPVVKDNNDPNSNVFSNNQYITELTSKDFDSKFPWVLKHKGKCVILFYAPWCGYCQRFKPDYIEFSKAAKSAFGDKLKIFAFNCEGPAHDKSNKHHLTLIREDQPGMVQGYPTVQIYENGKPTETYNGERSVQAMIAYFRN